MAANSEVFNTLHSMLEQECRLYLQYDKTIEEERRYISKFDTEKIRQLSSEREKMYELMKEAQAERRELIKRVASNSRLRLSDFISQTFSGQELKVLQDQVEKLRSLIKHSQSHAREFSQVVGFALKLVGGMASIIWSATQNVVRSYTSGGKIQETYHGSRARGSGLIKEI